MANLLDPNDPQIKAETEAWLAERPDCIKRMFASHPPWKLYRLKTSGHRVQIISYGEDGTVRVYVSGKYNRVLFERQVFGIFLDDLEECELPGPNEDVGCTADEAGYTEADVKNILIPELKKRGVFKQHTHDTKPGEVCDACESLKVRAEDR